MKKARDVFLLLILSLLLFTPRAFSLDFSEHENSVLQEIFRVRLEARRFASNPEALEFIKESRARILSDSAATKISDEAKITFENFFAWEEFHFSWEENPDDAAAWDSIGNQYKDNLSWQSSHPDEARNIWYSLSLFDLANSCMPKLKFSDVLKIGLEEKRFYDSRIEANSENCVVYFNAALWYSFAPAIGGGSDSKAEKYFAEAVKKAKNDYEKFFANLYFSQFEFDRGETALFEELFSAAEKILPQSGFLDFVRALNKSGFSYLEYTKNREKVEKALRRK